MICNHSHSAIPYSQTTLVRYLFRAEGIYSLIHKTEARDIKARILRVGTNLNPRISRTHAKHATFLENLKCFSENSPVLF